MISTHILDYIGYRSLELSHKLKGHQVHPPKSWERYIREDPFELRRITYPLNEDSLVIDLGGYKGEWSQQIYCRYRCMIDIYEPHPVLAAAIGKRFWGNPDIRVYPMALSDIARFADLHGNDIYASILPSDGCITEVIVDQASAIFNTLYSGKIIDLLKINIEGSEYDVLPDLIKNYDISTIRNIQVHFHNTVPDYVQKRAVIQQALFATHKQDWCYDYLYESWSVKQ